MEPYAMTTLDSLPTIIDGPGEYVTRGGQRATIHGIEGSGTFAAKGQRWRMFRGKVRPRDYDIWHVSGRNYALDESHRDIVGKYVGE